ncbi:MAG: holo-[acyl-carrier-protein] synthase [Zetaproteobacteria bacterium CG_4_9_14_3_um_filter_49_83]|nr:MAG: holo-[acyl-carrier-protein] synthase [Zetaproteobacteria bacterium CG1_02_49_23]PIQ33530.1 MAG: holo-[acyl-carrier-protein] synthase [Zetaproteobacteria bacterium CG17_big_fil_post_rev_8_21_14_2_50_50_13]PIV30212.1 MAG: holo-[acyl-carrier-protein] synthase [Zetaproteobacteria bacterium CG02_land_8_20_14_3_00_50_9]PIY56358.1 MAG: holo-[acyl-carrier-protein] synthase [Zetaproteobacteria bacterium CG_4_10_14_0_8_um_filter_49_80]PJA34755.1 MAG: holo-[acyl-carrier-protein] synthase [Zetaprot
MIVGIGVDQVSIARIESSEKKFGQRFLKRIYTDDEVALAEKKGFHRRLAMFFAAKEAVSKALGTGFTGFAMCDVEVCFLDSGQPVICLHRQAELYAKKIGVSRVHLSLSDDHGLAIAFAVAESI